MLSSYNLKNKQTIQISGLILQYCSATTLYRRLPNIHQHAHQREYILIDTKIVKIGYPQAELGHIRSHKVK